MAEKNSRDRELKSTSYEIFILSLSLLSIFNIFVLVSPGVSDIVKGVVRIMDAFITVAFMGDFMYRLFTAKSKSNYFFRNMGWADLLASMPVQQLKIFRLFRVVKVIRLLRVFGIKSMIYEIRDNRAGSALYTTVFLVILVLQFGGSAMVYIEAGEPDANIGTAADAVWWAFVTITTVGYGDHYPVSGTGRLVGMFVMMLGVGLFGVLTGFLANFFLAEHDEALHEAGIATDVTEPDSGGVKATALADLKRLLADQERTHAELKARIQGIEALLNACD